MDLKTIFNSLCFAYIKKNNMHCIAYKLLLLLGLQFDILFEKRKSKEIYFFINFILL